MFETNTGNRNLLTAGVGIMATPHRPQIISHEFLKTSGIVPDSWDIKSSQIEIQSGQSQITYENGVTFQLNGNHIHIYEDCAGQFKGDYLVFDLADRYLEKTLGAFAGVGITLDMWIYDQDPLKWIVRRFYRHSESDPFSDIVGVETELHFRMQDDFEEGTLSIRLENTQVDHIQKGPRGAVRIQAVAQFQDSDKTELRDKVASWRELHDSIFEKVIHIFEEDFSD